MSIVTEKKKFPGRAGDEFGDISAETSVSETKNLFSETGGLFGFASFDLMKEIWQRRMFTSSPARAFISLWGMT